MLRIGFISVFLLFTFYTSKAAIITSTATGGPWNSGTSWVGGIKPGSTDDVIISINTAITLDASTVGTGIKTLTIQTGGSLTLAGTNSTIFYIKGDIVNNGTLNLWISESQGASLNILGNSTWSGTGVWNLAQLNTSTYSIEFAADIILNINRGIIANQVSGSLNMVNKRAGVSFIFCGTENGSIPSQGDRFFYGNIQVKKTLKNAAITFTSIGSDANYNTIRVLGDIIINSPLNIITALDINDYNVLEAKGDLYGNGRLKGGGKTDLVISGNGNAAHINAAEGEFRHITINRPNGAILDSSITVQQILTLNNACRLILPSGNNFNLTIGTSSTAGTVTGTGYFVQPSWTLVRQLADITIKGTAPAVDLRFSQTGTENVIHELTIDKSVGVVNLVDGSLHVRNDFIFTKGIFTLGSGTLKLTGPISWNANAFLRGSTTAGLVIGNDVSSTAETIYFDQADASSQTLKTYRQFRNNNITLGNNLNVIESVDLSGGIASNKLISNGRLTLLSTATKTAYIANLGSSSITGNVNVQRYIHGFGSRGYRLLSSPVRQFADSYDISTLLSRTFITGPAGGGFDISPSNNPSIWIYREQDPSPTNTRILDSDYKGLHSINTQVPVGTGLLYFNRGSRNNPVGYDKLYGPLPIPEDNLLVFTGLLNQGIVPIRIPAQEIANFSFDSLYAKESPGSAQQSRFYYNGSMNGSNTLSYTNWYNQTQKTADQVTDGLNLLGNPYPSAISLDALTLGTDIGRVVYIFNPSNKQFSAYNITTGLSDGNGASAYIASGQGFFVRALAKSANATVTFTEACKINQPAQNPDLLMGKETASSMQGLILQLQKDSTENDAASLYFDNDAKDFAEEADAADLGGLSSSIDFSILSSDKKRLSLDLRPWPTDAKRVNLYTHVNAYGRYVLSVKKWAIKNREVFFTDDMAKDSIRLNADFTYSFNAAPSDSSNRFHLFILPEKTKNVSTQNSISIQKDVSWLYPNPVNTILNIALPDGGTCTVRIYNLQGYLLVKSLTTERKIDVTKLQPGSYILEMTATWLPGLVKRLQFIKH